MATTFVQLFIQDFEDCTLYSLAVFIKVQCWQSFVVYVNTHVNFSLAIGWLTELTVEIEVVGQLASST